MTAKALLVDDRRENLVALEAILQGLAVETVAVTSGEEALKRLLVDDYAVILLDASMPTMDGFEVATHIKQRERTRHIPIIFLTALDYDARLAFRGYQIGAVDFITKPFDPWVLRSKVAVFIDLWQKSAELTSQAMDQLALSDALTRALSLLAANDSDGAASVLRAAQAKHAVPRLR
ncbi:response regulator receiver domain-containing protein [Actinophytocola oryzae]|uniref:Response regulator receiver domain-containing protein n=1 Tax=Actinophytocola oryzae TaxID=502181 RepID=A0A4R7VAR4_9PSEU|nr:response regulator receiver domain-containing protein [Actinophytocola oryzae]